MKTGADRFTSGGGVKITVEAGAEGGEYVRLDIDGADVLLDDREALKLSVWLDAARQTSRLGWSPASGEGDGEGAEEPR